MSLMDNQLAGQQKTSWLMLAAGLAVGFVGLQLFVAGPMSREIQQMRRDLAQVERRMNNLVGARDAVADANTLLAGLQTQQAQIEAARESLQSIRKLQGDLIDEAGRNPAAARSLGLVKSLHARLIDQKLATELADSSFEQMKSLQDRVTAEVESNLLASKALDEFVALKEQVNGQADSLEQSQAVLSQFIQLAHQLRGQSAGIAEARMSLDGLEALKAGISEAARDLEVAQAVSAQLVSLEEQLAQGGEQATLASQQADRLIGLSETLAQDLDIGKSGENLAALLQLQKQVSEQSPRIADAIDTLEVLSGFQDEFAAQIQVLDEMRRDLVEISLMQTTLGKVTRMLQPLTELGNLRRLTDQEMRQVARSILEGRTTTRVSKNAEESTEVGSDTVSKEPIANAELVHIE